MNNEQAQPPQVSGIASEQIEPPQVSGIASEQAETPQASGIASEQAEIPKVSDIDAKISSLMEQLKISREENDKLKKEIEFLNAQVLDLKKKQEKEASSLIKDNDSLRAEVIELRKKQMRMEVTEESFHENDSKTKYFTGLDNYKVLFRLYKRVKPFLYNKNPAISPFEQLILTFLKLRLDLPFTYLSYR